MNKIWIRRDKQNGDESMVQAEVVERLMFGRYSDLKEAMEHASEQMPLTTGFADYWPAADQEKPV